VGPDPHADRPGKDVDLHLLLEAIGHTTIACGAAVMGEHVVLRHSLPLENLDITSSWTPSR